jgi:metallo-beta-lactamase family protein
MNITLHGAAGGEVTGSAYYVQTESANVLVDCGMFQGSNRIENFNRLPSQLGVDTLNAVILTHAHLDHTGRLPILAKMGYRGPVYGTPATLKVTDIILRDSAHLHMADVERENRKRTKRGQPLLPFLYEKEDVDRLRPLFTDFPYDTPTEIAPGLSFRAVEAGHMLGSASLEMSVLERGKKTVVIFSGDLGPRGAPLHKDPTPFKTADLVFLESTYGDRHHRSLYESAEQTRQLIREAVEAKAKILVPAFAVGRTQLLLYLLAGAFQRRELPPFPVYIDSPMAIEATRLYAKHTELFDEEALAMHRSGELRANLESVKFSQTAEDSKALNDTPGPMMIIAGAGMCNGGRILHHLRHNLSIPGTLVLIVGFQSHGSLGRMLVDGKTSVKMFGEEVPVNAKVHTIGGLSGHADQADLLHWFDTLAPCRPRVILTHGEDRARQAFAKLLREKYQLRAERPALGDSIEVN